MTFYRFALLSLLRLLSRSLSLYFALTFTRAFILLYFTLLYLTLLLLVIYFTLLVGPVLYFDLLYRALFCFTWLYFTLLFICVTLRCLPWFTVIYVTSRSFNLLWVYVYVYYAWPYFDACYANFPLLVSRITWLHRMMRHNRVPCVAVQPYISLLCSVSRYFTVLNVTWWAGGLRGYLPNSLTNCELTGYLANLITWLLAELFAHSHNT